MGTTETSILLKLVGAPLGVALLGWLLSYAIKHKTAWSAWLLAIFIAGAVGLSDQLLRGSTDWWPVDVTRRLPWFALGAALLGGLTYLSGFAWKVLNITGRFALSAFVAWQMTALSEPRWWWLAGTTLLLFVSWMALSHPLPLGYSWLVVGTWAAIAGITGGVLVLSGSASLGLVSVALGVSLGVVALLQLRWRHHGWQVVAGLVIIALFTLVLSGQQFAELPISSGLLLMTAPLTVLWLHIPILSTRPVIAAIIVLSSALLLSGGAAWLAKPIPTEKPTSENSNPYIDYYRK